MAIRPSPVPADATSPASSRVAAGSGVPSLHGLRARYPATLIDGPQTHVHVGRRRPYLQVAAVVAIAAAILAAGYLGPHVSPHASSSSSAASASASEPRPATPATPENLASNRLEALLGLPQIRNVPDETVTSLPLQISSTPAISGNRLFFVVGGKTLESSVIGSTADPIKLVSVRQCKAITEIAAAGDSLMYLVIWPESPHPTATGCDTITRFDWSLQLMDLRSGTSREVATGSRAIVAPEFDGLPIRFAITPTEYAYDRPNDDTRPNGPETVEVHSLDGKLLWQTTASSHVGDLDLAGDRLAVITQFWWPAPGIRTFFIATASHPAFQEVSESPESVALSADGLYAAWNITLRIGLNPEIVSSDVAVDDWAKGGVTSAYPPVVADGVVAMSPAVLTTSSGPFVAWLSIGPDGTAYPAFNWPGRNRSGFLESVQQPVWLAVSGNSLVWVAESSDGRSSVAYSADISNL